MSEQKLKKQNCDLSLLETRKISAISSGVGTSGLPCKGCISVMASPFQWFGEIEAIVYPKSIVSSASELLFLSEIR